MSRLRVPRRPPRRSPPRPAAELTLSDAFRAWVVDNAVRGVPSASLVATLIDGGVPARVAAAEVTRILASPALDTCRRLDRRASALELVAALSRAHARLAPAPAEVERRDSLPADEFFDRHFAGNRPVVLTRFMEGWGERARWTPASLAARFGDVEIEIMARRDADPRCDRNFEAHREKVRLREYVDRVTQAGRSNDCYLVAHNNVLQQTDLAGLLDDVSPDEGIFDPEALRNAVSFWLGPAGTVTPLHHDTTNILFCQVYGKKRVHLIAPSETGLLARAEGFYAELDCADPRFREQHGDVLIKQVDLARGEALFIPAGWWHRVEALEVSINLSLLGFRRPNDLGWYRPAG